MHVQSVLRVDRHLTISELHRVSQDTIQPSVILKNLYQSPSERNYRHQESMHVFYTLPPYEETSQVIVFASLITKPISQLSFCPIKKLN